MYFYFQVWISHSKAFFKVTGSVLKKKNALDIVAHISDEFVVSIICASEILLPLLVSFFTLEF